MNVPMKRPLFALTEFSCVSINGLEIGLLGITSHEQYARYQRIAGELARKYDAETRSSLEFIRSPDGVLLTSLEARMAEWDTFLGAMLSHRPAKEAT
jgi:hypothetical protein